MPARRWISTLGVSVAWVLSIAGQTAAQPAQTKSSPGHSESPPAQAESPSGQTEAPPSVADRLREILMTPPDIPAERAKPDAAERAEPAPPRTGPGFVAPLSSKTATGRAGVAGWTSSGSTGARGRGDTHQPGWAGFGFAVEWGGARQEAP